MGTDASRKSDFRLNVTVPPVGRSPSAKDTDLVWIAGGLFAYEGLLRKELISGDEPLELLVSRNSEFDTDLIEQIVSEILGFALQVTPKVKVTEIASGKKNLSQSIENFRFDSISLFSGGTDSLCGIAEAKATGWSPLSLYVQHSAGTAANVTEIENSVLERLGVPLARSIVLTPGGWQLQQLRGLLYTVNAGVCASRGEVERVLISESGPTMLLPRFSPLDTVTLTTHPYILRLAHDLLEKEYHRKFTVVAPYAQMTKAESIASCRVKDSIAATHSCANTLFARHPLATHCGSCFGCIVRRMSCLVASVGDAGYTFDPFGLSRGHAGRAWRRGQHLSDDAFAEVLAVLLFARKVLEDKLPPSIQLHMDANEVGDLFRRFSLDMLAGLYVIDRGRGLKNRTVETFYRECLQDGVFTAGMATSRIADVRSEKYRPDFSVSF